MVERCFWCGKFAKDEDVGLFQHRVSKLKRWFHIKERVSRCSALIREDNWEKIDPLLGETTDKEMDAYMRA